MSDVKRLTRDQLAKFLPDPRAVRAFEGLIDQVSVQLPAQINIIIADTAALQASIDVLNTSLAALAEEVNQVEQLLGDEQSANLSPLLSGIDSLSQLVETWSVNLDPLVKRIEALEALVVP